MNVIRTERILQPSKKRCEVKPRELNVPLTKYHLSKFDIEKRRRTSWKPASSNYLKSSRFQSLGRSTKRTRPPISSSLVTSTSRNYASRTETRVRTGDGASSLLETTGGAVILAVTTGRGDARSEVGIAALDIRCSHLILCQISDSQMYANTLSKLYLFDPIEASLSR
ncbi:MutS protein homolog 4 [Anthophora quadrimaculata]